MARGKKAAKALTLEEKLEQALVPEEEQPYAIPENWCWIYTPILFDIEYGKGLSTKQLTEEGYPVFGANGQIGYYDQYMFEKPRAIMSCRGTCGIMHKTLPYSFVTSNSLIINGNKIDMTPSYICYMFSALDTSMLVTGTVQPQVTIQAFSEYPIPLIPLAEQQRIVTRIENLFAKLDEAKEKAQVVIDSFELRKSAILHKAFTGELTERWRKKHGVGLDSWETVTSKKLFEYVTSGSRGWAQYYSQSGAVFVRMGNLQHSTIELDMSSIQYVDLPDKAEGQRSLIKKNDILISITADVGMIGLVRDIDFEGYINQHVALARPAEPESAEFIAWYLVSDVGFKQFRKKQRGATKVGLGLNDIRTLCLDMPIMAEQKEILNILNRLMIKEHQAKQAAESVLAQIDTMKKAILVRAFRGELGTNNPSDENAIELLKEVLAEKN